MACGRSANRTGGASSASKRGSASSSSASVQPLPVIAAGAPRRRDRADLARAQHQPPAVKRLAERRRHRLIAVPAELEHRGLEPGEVERRARGPRGCRSHGSPDRPRRVASSGSAERDAQSAARPPPCADRRRSARPGCPARQRQAPPRARRPRRRRPPRSGRRSAARASHQPFSAVSMFAASTARASGTAGGSSDHRIGRHDVAVLVRMQAEHPPARATARCPRPPRRPSCSRT